MAGSKNSSNHIKRSPGDQTVQVLIYIFIGAFAIACVVPFIYVFAGSFATEKELTERPFFLIPHEFSLNAYRYVTKTGSSRASNSAGVTSSMDLSMAEG